MRSIEWPPSCTFRAAIHTFVTGEPRDFRFCTTIHSLSTEQKLLVQIEVIKLDLENFATTKIVWPAVSARGRFRSAGRATKNVYLTFSMIQHTGPLTRYDVILFLTTTGSRRENVLKACE